MKVNASKTKEILVSFSKTPPDVPHITVNGEELERVTSCTLLGIDLNNSLNWTDHVDKIYKKASKRLHFLSQLKRTKMSPPELAKVYTSLIRPVLEYSAQLWHPGLTEGQSDLLESIQQRAMAIAYPSLTYEDALVESNLSTLGLRRDDLCKRLFTDCQDQSHKLNSLLPKQRHITHNQRNA